MALFKPESVQVRPVDPSEIDIDLAYELQNIGFLSWQQELPGRSEAQIARVFGTENAAKMVKKRNQYIELARTGSLVVAESRAHDVPIGYAAARNDISGSAARVIIKKFLIPSKVYACIDAVAVHPDFRDRGIDERLVRTVLADFRPEQIPTTYIFAEDEHSQVFFGMLGFGLAPARQAPKITTEYFGDDYLPVAQYRYEALSVDGVRQLIAAGNHNI